MDMRIVFGEDKEDIILDNIRKGMEYREMGHSQLADSLEWSVSKVSKIMSGTQKMSLNDFLKICASLKFRCEDVLRYDFTPGIIVRLKDNSLSSQANDVCNAIYRKASEEGLYIESKKDGSVNSNGHYERMATFSLNLRGDNNIRRWSFLVDENELTPRDGMGEYAMVFDTLKEDAAGAFLTDYMDSECYQWDKFTIVICNEYVFSEFIKWVGDMEFNGLMSVMLYDLGRHEILKEVPLKRKGIVLEKGADDECEE